MKVGGATWPRFVRSFGHLVAEIVEHVEAGHARAFPNKCTDDFRANSPATAGHNYTLVPHLHRLVILSGAASTRSEEHTSELQSLMRISYAVFCLKKKKSHSTTKRS